MKKGLSNLIAFILVIMMTLTVGASFYFWFSNLSSDSMAASETFTEEVQEQVITRATSIIDQYYKTDNEQNLNNFGEITQTICADDKSVNIDSDEISFELYEGYGSNTELVCSKFGLSCGCESETQKIIGVMGGNNSHQGITLLTSNDGSAWTPKNLDIYSGYNKFDFNHLGDFVEGGDNCTAPKNLILMGAGRNSELGTRIAISAILNNSLVGNSYNTKGLDDNVTEFFDITQSPIESGDPKQHLFKGGALVDPLNQQHVEAIITRQFSPYDKPERLLEFGTNGRSISNAAITAVQRIIRNGNNQLLVGVTGNLSAGGVSYIDETQDIVGGIEQNYPVSGCPYDASSFEACGFDPGQVAACTIEFGGIPAMFYAEEFSGDSNLGSEKPVFIGVNAATVAGKGTPFIFYTGYDSPQTIIYCLDTTSLGMDIRLNITDITYFDNLSRVAVFLKSNFGTTETEVLFIEHLGPDYIPSLVTLPTPISIKTFATLGNSIFAGGTDYTNSYIFDLEFTELGNLISMTQVYTNTSYQSIEQLETFTQCTDRKVYCKEGCDQTLKRGECSDLTLSIEDSDCDISKYGYETDFTSRLNIGNNFQILNVFTKEQKSSIEVNATAI